MSIERLSECSRTGFGQRRAGPMPRKYRQRHKNGIDVVSFSSVWLMVLLALLKPTSLVQGSPDQDWITEGFQRSLIQQKPPPGGSSLATDRNKEGSRKLQERTEDSWDVDSERPQNRNNNAYPQRVKIAPFDLLLAPTPIQLVRSDEDLLLVELQELIILFMRTQIGKDDSITSSRMESDTTIEYVLFSDIVENSFVQGRNMDAEPPRSVLRFNGGVASFIGPYVPSEETANEWVERAVNEFFPSALTGTPYNYIELAKYVEIEDSRAPIYPGDIPLGIEPASSYIKTKVPRPVQQVSQEQTQDSTTIGNDFPLTQILMAVLIAFAVIAAILALWVWHNNRAVRVICLSSKEKEEIVDFCDQEPVSIDHQTTKEFHSHDTDCIDNEDGEEDEEDEEDGGVLKKDSLIMVEDDWQNQISVAAQCAVEEASLQSMTSTSEYTIPTVSALSFRNPNPFNKGLASQESFQKERKTYLSKDMLYSTWSGKAPNFDLYGKRKDESVLKPSYFSAAKERAFISTLATTPEGGDEQKISEKDSEDSTPPETREFRFEAAHEVGSVDDGPDGLYLLSSSRRSRKSYKNKASRQNHEHNMVKRAPSDLV